MVIFTVPLFDGVIDPASPSIKPVVLVTGEGLLGVDWVALGELTAVFTKAVVATFVELSDDD